MKFFVAFLLVLTTFSSGLVIQGQSPSRRTNQSAVSKPKTETLRICQGVPVPDGYVIIAYMTSSACPHGAYLLKKQSDYESSLAVNDSARRHGESPTETATRRTQSSNSTAAPGGTSTQSARKLAPPASAIKDSQPSVQSTGDAASPAGAASGARPRRGGAAAQNEARRQSMTQSREEPTSSGGPPTLIGSAAGPASRPPTLTTPGTSTAPSATASSDAATPAGPEEVGEGDIVRVNTSLVTV